MCDLRHFFVSSATVGVLGDEAQPVLVTFNAKAQQEVGGLSPVVHCVEQLRESWIWGESCSAFSSWRIVFKLRNTSGKQHFLSFLGVTHEWQATVITRHGICQAMCSACSCHSVKRWAEGSARSKLIILMNYVTFCNSTVFVTAFISCCTFLCSLNWEKTQRLQSPAGQIVARSRGCIWKLQGKCPKIINLGTPQAAVDQQWIHIIEFQANHASLRVKLWINIRQNTPSGEPCLM